MVFGLKDFVLGSVCFSFICILSCLMGQKKIVLKYIVFYVVIAAIQQLCIYLPQAIETILSIFTLFIRVMIPVVLFASTFIATTKVSELIAAMYSLKIPRSITITFAMVLRFFPTFSEEIHNIYDAMKLRGIALSWKNVFTRPMLILEAITIPIVMRSASIAEELSASAVTRGIDNPAQRTSFIQLKVHAKDWMVLCFFLVAFVVLFFCKYQIWEDMMMIDIDHVSFQYSGAEQENLQDFNLQIKKGECVVLTGESGCGKTCVTRLINTLIPHFYEGEMSGAVLIDGVDTRTIQPHDLSDKIGSVFQNPRSQFFSLDTDSEIVFGMENKGMPYQVMLDRYQQTIRELHIEKLKDRNLFDLSGGQKQTIAFASVYALNPDIFVLDEPSSNLDPEAIQELRRLLLLIKAQGKTIVVSEHRLYFLNGIADRIVLMEHGKLKQSWSASDFALFNAEQIKALGLRSYTPTRLELPDTMPSRNEPPAVEVKDLAIGYEKGEPVAQHLNFRVYPGEIVGVVGKNGCGKSTLARTLCGLQKELRGEVLYKNSMVPSKRRIRKAYLVMQDPDYQLFTDSVYQELLLALSDQKDKDEKRIDDILDELNLTIYKERHPMSLSGGQKQRTAIGVAALRDAEVLIFDEPTSGLDYKNMESVAEILSALSKRGKAILVISHDNELLMKICSRVIRVDERTSS